MDQNVRIMVAPVPETEKTGEPVFLRETYADLAAEYYRRRNNRRDFRKAQTKEEQEELRKFRLREMYKDIAYTRFYMLCGFFIVGASSYIMFRKNKRLPLVNSMVHEQTKKLLIENKACKQHLGERLFFPNQTIGAKIGDEADFEFKALGETGKYAVAQVRGTFNEKNLDWVIHQMEVSIFDEKGQNITREEIKTALK